MRAKKDKFVKVPLWWAEHAAQATRTPAALVWIRILYLAWRDKNPTIKLPNKKLAELGVSRHVKNRVLRKLEEAGSIKVVWRHKKSPIITLLHLEA